MMSDQDAYDVPGFARAHSISRSQTYEEIKAGRLRILKVGRRTLISREAALAWRRSHEEATLQCRAANALASS